MGQKNKLTPVELASAGDKIEFPMTLQAFTLITDPNRVELKGDSFNYYIKITGTRPMNWLNGVIVTARVL